MLPPRQRHFVLAIVAAFVVALVVRSQTSRAFQERYEPVYQAVACAREHVNRVLEVYEPWQIALLSVVAFLAAKWLLHLVYQEEPIFVRLKRSLFALAKMVPPIRKYIQAQLSENLAEMETSIIKIPEEHTIQLALPHKGLSREEVLHRATVLAGAGEPEKRHADGRVSGTIYVGGKDFDEYSKTLTEVYGMFAWTNPLHIGVFPGVRQMEAEIISVCCSIFNGGPDSCGTVTSGGTESILMALKAYRDQARATKGIYTPNIVVPRTAHPAFDKGCQFFNIAIRKVDEDPVTRKANVKAMARYIDSNTILLVGSCPQYPHGVVDPIEDLAALARRYDIGLHVDCCLGSFIVPFMRKAGFKDFPSFDFSVPGVTSISADTHKYGCAPKGSSVVLYSNKDLRQFQYSVFPDWPGGIYGTPTVAGSRPGALIAATWAALMSHGEEGYIHNTKTTVTLARKLATEISKIPGIKLVAPPDATVVAWTSDVFDVNRMCEGLMEERHWDLNVLQFPPSIHICITMAHSKPGIIDKFIEDMREVAAPLYANPGEKVSGQGAIYGMSQSIPDRTIIEDIVRGFLDVSYMVKKTDTSDQLAVAN